jgi:hypothetical protein
MIAIAKGQASGKAVEVFLTDPSLGDALMQDPVSLAFAVYSTSSGSLVQLFPTTPGQVQAVNLSTNRIGIGHFFATFTMPSGAQVGPGQIQWFYTMASGFQGQSVVPIEVLNVPSLAQTGYCSLSDVRAEGVLSGTANDARVLQSISSASRYIERVTERWFEPRYRTFSLDGTGNRVLEIPAPIIAIESVVVTFDGVFAGAMSMDAAGFRVYARHLTDGMLTEDDRAYPKINLRDAMTLARIGVDMGVWPRGTKNIQVKGVFGYTNYDGSPTGQTPDQVREIAIAIAITRAMEKIANRSPASGPVTMEKTRDQEVQYSDTGLNGIWTGDSDIDMMLESFRRPPTFAAA